MFVALSKNYNMRIGVLISFLAVYTLSFSSDYQRAIRDEIAKKFGNASEDKNLMLDYNHFVVIEKDTFVVPNGYHYVFKLVQGKPIRQDESTFHGDNFYRYLFAWKKTIYALGGYGFFQTKNHLTYFQPTLKGWLVEKTSGNIPPYLCGVTYTCGKNIISFNNHKIGNEVEHDKLDSAIYLLDIEKKHWTKKTLNPKACLIGRVFYFKEFVLSIGNIHSLLVKRNSKQFIKIENDKVGLNPRVHPIDAISGNTLTVLSYENHRKQPLHVLLHMDQLWKKYPKENLICVNTASTNTWFSVRNILLLLVVGLGISMFYYFSKKRKSTLSSEYTSLEQKLLSEKHILNTEELDAIFAIEHMDADSKKFKRNRIINEINQRHPHFISRTKDDTDKRRYLYRIKQL